MKRWPILVLIGCAAAFGLGVFQLFELRFESGDVYPEYSSLRSDPLGTMALYEGLERMDNISVRRDFNAGNQLPPGKNTTYLHLSASRLEWIVLPEELVAEVERFVRAGGRLAITFFPETSGTSWAWTASATPPASRKKRKSNQPQKPAAGQRSLKESLGIEFGLVPFTGEEVSSNGAPVLNQSELKLPKMLNWHSAMIFTNLDAAWQTVYARGTNPVVVERRFGAGTVVMASDSYFVSNEALTVDRHPDLLAWFVGPARDVVFDEAHLGIVESSSITSLMRKYRLHGMVAGFVLLAVLFIWKNSSTFAPTHPRPESEDSVMGRQVVDGFVNLLRRNIAPRDLLTTCFEEWTKSLGRGTGYSITRVDEAQAVIEAENARAQTERKPVRAYREICRALKGEKPGGTAASEPAANATHQL
jgi:hypothetical protein